jgi:hypothetical protein
MRCPKCGQENPVEAKFCGKCATRLVPTEPAIPGGSVGPPPNADEVSQGLNVGIIIGTLIIPLLGIIMGVVYMKDPSPAKQAAGKVWLYVGIGVLAVYCLCTLASGVLNNMGNQYRY